MSNIKDTPYYLGLDCGTSSVGFAVTDLDYNVLSYKGKSLWGSHLFDEAQTAQERRGLRCARRRLQRRKQRTALLQELFADEIYKVDPTFFIRLNDSHYIMEDKNIKVSDILFNDDNYKDKDFFRTYPTIYHLRRDLINGQIRDPRMLYLAIAHILKHRGHFLFPGENMSSVTNLNPLIEQLKEQFDIVYNESIDFKSEKDLEAAFRSRTKTERIEKLTEVIELEDSKLKTLLVKTLVGYKVKPQQLFHNDDYSELCQIEFQKNSFEDADMPALEESLDPDEFKIIRILKAFFDWSLLETIRDGKCYISDAKIALYENNKADLKALKQVILKYAPEKYDAFFHEDGNSSFVNYIGKNHDRKKSKEFRTKRVSVDEFYKSVKNILKDADNTDSSVNSILTKIDNDSFMPLLSSFRNGVVPYQLNKLELEAILQACKTNFPWLENKDEEGLSISDKILSILAYRIPYYVGPLNKQNDKGKNWIVRNESGRILPWNIKKKVDYSKSAEEFILRMTNKCTYCKQEDVLPKNSLAYSKYMVLNDLNNVRIKGVKLSVSQKQTVFENLFKKKKKVTCKALVDFAVKEGWYLQTELTKEDISGIDGDFKSSMSSYFDFKEYLESGKLKAEDVDQIIKWITIFSEGGEILKERISSCYGKQLSESDVNKIIRLKYSGWGRFSHKFLYEIYAVNNETGELLSVMGMLWETQHNLMELLSGDYEFVDQIDQPLAIGKLEYSVVDDLYVSPAVKKQIWQTLKVVNEIHHIMGHAPKKVFIEVTRHSESNDRKVSRKNDLITKLREAQKSGSGFDIEFQNMISSLDGTDESAISRQDKLYLYYSQCGKCMYSGEPISLDNLYDVNIYDIDHIFPYSKSNDDSLKNKVLVLKKANARKSNDYPIDDSVRNKMKPYWEMLYKKNFIPKEKYERLCRTSPLNDEDLKGFIARQLVETNQNVKASASILKAFFGDETKVVYSKASNVSDFRNKYEFNKCRSMNDLHHAKDAYLNVVVGNVYDTKYTSNFYLHLNGQGYGNLSKIYDFDVVGAWKKGNEGTLKTVRKIMSKNDILYTKQPVERKGALFDLQVVKKGEKKGALPVKTSDPVLLRHIKEDNKPAEEIYEDWNNKYGGYNSLTTGYFSLVGHFDEKGKYYATFVPISIIDSKRLGNESCLLEYCKKTLKMIAPKIIRKKLLVNTELEINGYRVSLAGKSSGGAAITANSTIGLILSNESQRILKRVESFLSKKKENKTMVFNAEHDKLSDSDFAFIYKEIVEKGKTHIYTLRPASQQTIIEGGYDIFMDLDGESKCRVIAELMKYYGMGNGQADLTSLGGKKVCGTIKFNARINLDKYSLTILDKSVTGVYETKTVIEK